MLAHLPQHGAQLDHPLELRAIAVRAKIRVVAILLPSTRVARRDLEVSLRHRTDPDVAPRRRDRQGAEATDARSLPDDATVRIEIGEPAADATPVDAGHRVRHVPKPRRFRGSNELSSRSVAHDLSRTWPTTRRRARMCAPASRERRRVEA